MNEKSISWEKFLKKELAADKDFAEKYSKSKIKEDEKIKNKQNKIERITFLDNKKGKEMLDRQVEESVFDNISQYLRNLIKEAEKKRR